MKPNMLNKVPPGVCPSCAIARTMLHLLFREVVQVDEIDLVATDKDGKVMPFSRMYVACGHCDDTGRVPVAEGLEMSLEEIPDVYPSKLPPSRLDEPKEGEVKPVKQEQKGKPK